MKNSYTVYETKKEEFSPQSIVETAFSNGTHAVLVFSENLPDEFFDLKTGVLGEATQKLMNYNITTAIVLDATAELGDRFNELILEHRNNRSIRFFEDETEARKWLG